MADMKRPLEQQISEVGREIGLRKNVYPGMVTRGKMRQSEADEHIARLEAAYATLKWLHQHRDRVLAIYESTTQQGETNADPQTAA